MKWSTSGISAARSRPYFWTMQPATTTRSISPASLRATSRRIAPTDSSFAESMNPHVFTMTTRDFSGSVSVKPLALEVAEHDLGVDEVLRAAEGDDADGREGKGRSLGHQG